MDRLGDVPRRPHDPRGWAMASSTNEREDITEDNSRAWRKTLDRTRWDRRQRGENYQPRHRSKQVDQSQTTAYDAWRL